MQLQSITPSSNLHSILKSITLSTKVHIVKAMVFPVVLYRCKLDHKEGWVLKNLCFRIVVLEKTLESCLDYMETKPVNPIGNQLSIFTWRIDTEADFGHLLQKTNSLEKILMLRKIEGIRRRGQQRKKWWESITHSVDMNLSKLQEIVKDREA